MEKQIEKKQPEVSVKEEIADKKEDKSSSRKDPNVVQLMKKGDYIVHILVEEIRNLIGKDESSVVLPNIKISCLGTERRTTKLKQGCANYTFSEHFYFERNNMAVEELDSEKILIEVIDGNKTNREDYLGIYEIDFTSIYNNKDHSIQNFWVALANPESEDITKVRGFLKLSASVLQENDLRVELTYKSTDDPNAMCVIPPQVKMEYKQISIYILKGEQFPDMDFIYKESKTNKDCNGFVKVKYLGFEVESSVRDQKEDIITWNEILDIPVSFPVVSQKIVVEVWDKDFKGNDIIGSFELNINDITNDKYKELRYVPIYGAPLGVTGNYTNKMNANSEIGSLWKGRILMKIEQKPTDTPRKAVRKIEDTSFLMAAGKLGKPNKWFFNVFLYDAMFLPEESSEYGVKICIQEKNIPFNAKVAKKRCIQFNQADDKTFIETLTKDIKNVPDLFIYLTYKKVNICFQRIPVETFFNNEDIMVIKLLPDPSIGKVSEFVYSGIVKLRIKVTNDQNNINFSKIKNLDVSSENVIRESKTVIAPPKEEEEEEEEEDELTSRLKRTKTEVKKEIAKPVVKPTTQVEDKSRGYMVIANIHMSRHLIAGDPDGTSDPYVVVNVNEAKKATSIKYNCVNCIWNESLIFENVDLNINDKSTWPILFLRVYDKDIALTKDDLLAFNYVWLNDSSFSKDNLDFLRPKWIQLNLPVSNRPQGQLLCSFYIIDMKKTDLVKKAALLDITPETELFSFEINILGLRDLKPLSVMPVKKPFIAFDLNSINISGKEDSNMKLIKTQPKNSGCNPTINAIIKFDVRLPIDEIFMPDMQCVVYDYILSGFINQMLGVFNLPLRSIINENSRNLKKCLGLARKELNEKLGRDSLYSESERAINKSKISSINRKLVSNSNANEIEMKIKMGTANIPSNKNSDLTDMKIFKNDNNLSNPLLSEEVVLDMKNINSSCKEEKRNSGINAEDLNMSSASNNKAVAISQVNCNDPSNFLIKPTYKSYTVPGSHKDQNKSLTIEDKSKIPSVDLYKSIGYNKTKDSENKHYRRFFNSNLEDAVELGLKSPFYKIHLNRGKFIDQTEETGIFEALKDKDNKIIKRFLVKEEKLTSLKSFAEKDSEANKYYDNKTYGDFKGLVRIVEKSELKKYNDAMEEVRMKGNEALLSNLRNVTEFEDISKLILVERECVVRVYILELGQLKAKDVSILGDSESEKSDPYVKLYLAGQVIDETKNFLENKTDCLWCKSYDFTAVFPGDGNLKIEVWDNDAIFADDLIGTTTIDIEDRFFDSKWRDIEHKPIEKRNLYHPDLEGPQGWVSLWVEVIEKKQNSKFHNVKWDISPPPTVDLEMRLIVWETEDTPCMDVEDMSDYYVVAFLDSDKRQSTDVHYRCEKGNMASFNWRIVMPVTAPRKNTLLNIQVMDNDIFSSDDYASGSTLDIRRLIEDVYDLNIPMKFTESFWNALNNNQSDFIQFVDSSDDGKSKDKDKFWLRLSKQGSDNASGGRVLLSLEILPKWKADICKVGKGRDEPNINPYLPPPIGRFQFALNPFSMVNQCVGARYRRKMYTAICCGALILYLIFVIPYILLHLSGEAFNPFNYK